MKKALLLTFVVILLVGCRSKRIDLKMGIGVYTTITEILAATPHAHGFGEVSSVFAAVTINDDGVIVHCKLDEAATRVVFSYSGAVVNELSAIIMTKAEFGDSYGLRHTSPINKEWHEQAAAFAQWVVGKTMREVKAIELKTDPENYGLPAEPELAAVVAIPVTRFINAIEKAYNNARQAQSER